MKIVRKHQAKEFKNSDACIAYEYELEDKDINGALIKLDGRYPEKDFVVNEVCKELVYVAAGKGTLVTEQSQESIQTGDMFILMPGEKFYFEGQLEMLMPCTPAWYPEQHKIVN